MIDNKNVVLSGFELEPTELLIVKKSIETYIKKIKERATYQELKLSLKKSLHGKAFLHEIKGSLIAGKSRLTANASNYNLFSALSEVFERLLNEIEHKQRTPRQLK